MQANNDSGGGIVQPHDVWWVCEFCQVRLQGEVRKRLHKTSTFSPC